MSGTLEGKVALITGGARGQGRAHATTLASEGADIVIFDQPHDVPSVRYDLAGAADLTETVALVQDLGRKALAVTGDVRRQDELDRAVSTALETFGRLDICIANAGIWTMSPFWQMSEEQWSETIDINLSGVWRTVKAVAPHFIQRHSGAIVMTASVNAIEAGKNCTHYTAAKHGLLGLMKTVALELAPHGVRCNAVCPGAIDTPMTNWQGAYDAYAGHKEGRREDYVNAGRHYAALAGTGPMSPQVIADAALWLVSDRAEYVTGIAVPVEAGHLLLPGYNHSPTD